MMMNKRNQVLLIKLTVNYYYYHQLVSTLEICVIRRVRVRGRVCRVEGAGDWTRSPVSGEDNQSP